MHQNQWKVKTKRKLYRRCFIVTNSGARKTKMTSRTLKQSTWKLQPLVKRQDVTKKLFLMDGKLNKSNLKMPTDLLNIKYHRLRRFCIMNKASESKLIVTKVMISTTFIQWNKKWTISGTEIYVPTPVT